MAAIDPKLLGDDYQNERYIPKGFRTGEYEEGEKIYSQKDNPENYSALKSGENEPAIELWFSPNQQKTDNGIQLCTMVTIGDTSYNFTHKPLEVQTKMDAEGRRNFRKVLEGFKEGSVMEFELRNIARNPSFFLPAQDASKVRISDEIIESVRHVQAEVERKIKEGQQMLKDEINHPSHYNQYKGIEVIDVTEQLNFNRGNAVKYVSRAGFKSEDTEVQDLKKALWYITRELEGWAEHKFEVPAWGSVEIMALVGQMNFFRGSAVLHIARAGRPNYRDTELDDLKLGRHYIQHELTRLKDYKND